MKHSLLRIAVLVRAVAIALAITCVTAGCGVGISLDPSQEGRLPDALPPAEDGSPARGDGSERDADAPATDAPPRSDGGIDTAPIRDSAPEADRSTDGSDDAARDGFSDVAKDGVGDAFQDALDDRSEDGHDVSIDVIPDAGADVSADNGVRDAEDAAVDERDAVADVLGEAGGDASDSGCPATGCIEPTADYYVDATASDGGDGSKLRPFRTITQALQAYAGSPGQAKKAYIRAGTYDEALGERFPLISRGLSLEGAGQSKTIIVGAGWLDHAAEGGWFARQYLVTLAAADRQLPVKISNLSVQAGAPVPRWSYFGVFCDRGNATGEVPSPGGTTHLDQVTVGPGYDRCLVAATSTLPSATGCNMLVTGSTLTRSWMGVSAVGSMDGEPLVPVLIQMGNDDPKSGNTVSWMQHQYDWAAGAELGGYVPRASFQNNAFMDSAGGVGIYPNSDPGVPVSHFTFKHNSFERLASFGVSVQGSQGFVDELSDNRFVDLSLHPEDPQLMSIAVGMDLMKLGKVRRNEFIGTDIAMSLGFSAAAGQPADLGTAADPGGNVFRCNSALLSAGGDLRLYGDDADPSMNWGGTVPMRGNAWDHLPPTLYRDVTAPNGADIAVLNGPQVVVDIAGSTLATPTCPSGRITGP